MSCVWSAHLPRPVCRPPLARHVVGVQPPVRKPHGLPQQGAQDLALLRPELLNTHVTWDGTGRSRHGRIKIRARKLNG